ncbi:MAG: hypothetical protein M0000_06490 [Actinomycetota bacterium]|nr:hypothetical protein [Actinomycetota bacterium]
MFAILAVFGRMTGPLESFVGVCVATVCGLVVISQVHYASRLGRSFTTVVLAVFVVKIAIGVGHYLYFFEPNYFTKPLGYFPWSYGFGQLPEGMQNIAHFWHTYGFTGVPQSQIVEKSWMLGVYHAMLYYLSGDHFLNFVPWASFHTVLVGFLVASLALEKGTTRRQATAAFVLTSLQPLFWYTDLPERDIVGQFFVVLAIYLLVHRLDKGHRLLPILPVALALVYAQRWVYPLVIVVFVVLASLLAKHKARVAAALSGIFVAVLLVAGPLVTRLTVGNYGGDLPTTPDTAIPQAVLAGVIGPFPWTQVFSVEDALIHLPPDLVQAWLGVVIWMIVLPRVWRRLRATGMVDELVLVVFLFSVSGVLTVATHTVYVHVVTVLLFPVACRASVREWAHKAVVVSYLYLFGHLAFYGLGLEGHNFFRR